MGRITKLFDGKKGGWHEENKPVWGRGSSALLLHDSLMKQTKPARNGLWCKPCAPRSSSSFFGPAERNHPSSIRIPIWPVSLPQRSGLPSLPKFDPLSKEWASSPGNLKVLGRLPYPHIRPVLSAH